jgi:hypothetical protein
MKDFVQKPSVELVRRALRAGVDAGKVAVEAGHQATAKGVVDYVERVRSDGRSDDDRALVDRVVRAHVMLARGEGAAAGLATTTAEATTLVGTAGTLTIPSMVAITATDLTGLLWIQVRMVLTIADLYGHDPTAPARIREFLSLQGAAPATAAPAVAGPLSAAAGRVTTRLVTRHLRGELLVSVTALFRAVGIKFSRAALLRQVFLLNIPVNVLVNSAATRRLAQKARRYYETLPAAPLSEE